MPDYEINIRTKGDSAAADKVKSGLAGITEQAKAGATSGGLFGNAIAGAAAKLATFAAALKLAKDAISAYAEAQQASAKLDAALAQTGQLTDAYRERLQALATQLQKTTAIADEQWLDVFKRLTQFGADSSNIDGYADAVKNLAGIIGGDINTAANMFSRAMQGNFTLFARYGIQVGEAGTQTERLQKLMQELAKRGAGQLEASARTLTGQWNILKHATGDLLEAIGGGVAKTGLLQRALSMLSTAAEYWANKLGGVIPKLEGLTNAQTKTTLAVEDGATAAKKYADRLDAIKQAAEAAATATDRLKDRIVAAARAEQELADIDLAEQLQTIDEREKLGRISPADATRARGAAQRQSAVAKQRREERRTAGLVWAEQLAAHQADLRRADLEARLAEQSGLLGQVTAAEEGQSQIGGLESKLEAIQAEIAARRARSGGRDPGLPGATAYSQLLARRIIRARARGIGLPPGTPPSSAIAADIEQLKKEIAAQAAVPEANQRNIEDLQAEAGLRANIAPRQIALEQRRTQISAALEAAGREGEAALRANGEAFLRQLQRLTATAHALTNQVQSLEPRISNLEGQANRARNR